MSGVETDVDAFSLAMEEPPWGNLRNVSYRSGRLLERNFFIWNCTLLLVGFIRLVIPIAALSRVEELDPVHVNKIPVMLSARFLVIPRLSALAALQVNTTTFVKVLAGDCSTTPESFDREPFSAFLQFAILVLPALGTVDRELRNDRAPWAVLQLGISAEIADYQDLLHGAFTP